MRTVPRVGSGFLGALGMASLPTSELFVLDDPGPDSRRIECVGRNAERRTSRSGQPHTIASQGSPGVPPCASRVTLPPENRANDGVVHGHPNDQVSELRGPTVVPESSNDIADDGSTPWDERPADGSDRRRDTACVTDEQSHQ